MSSAAATDGIGNYVVLNVTPGQYRVTVTAPGFETGEAQNANLVIDQKLLLNFQVETGRDHDYRGRDPSAHAAADAEFRDGRSHAVATNR